MSPQSVNKAKKPNAVTSLKTKLKIVADCEAAKRAVSELEMRPAT
jgi:hypothetical protein